MIVNPFTRQVLVTNKWTDAARKAAAAARGAFKVGRSNPALAKSLSKQMPMTLPAKAGMTAGRASRHSGKIAAGAGAVALTGMALKKKKGKAQKSKGTRLDSATRKKFGLGKDNDLERKFKI